MASFWHTWPRGRPLARSASACRSFLMTCSGVWRVRMSRLLCPSGLWDSHTTWTTFWGAGQAEPELNTVFYSWQTDLEANVNRNFINAALENAVKLLKREGLQV